MDHGDDRMVIWSFEQNIRGEYGIFKNGINDLPDGRDFLRWDRFRRQGLGASQSGNGRIAECRALFPAWEAAGWGQTRWLQFQEVAEQSMYFRTGQ